MGAVLYLAYSIVAHVYQIGASEIPVAHASNKTKNAIVRMRETR